MTPPATMPSRTSLWWLPLLAAGLAFIVAPTAGLVWDDQIVAGQQLLAFNNFADVLQPPAGIPQWSYAYYRPVVVASYLLDAWLFGIGSAIGPHAMNVLYHMLATLFVWLLARRLLAMLADGGLAALAAATLFAVHPIHTESVSWVTGRSDLLATLCLLPALHLALRWRDEGATWQLLLGPVLFLLALLAKEVAIAGLAILPLLWLTTPRPAGAPAGSALFPIAATAVGWLGATWAWWSLRVAGGATLSVTPSGSEALLWNPLRAAAWYLQKLVLPWPQANFAVWEMVPAAPVSLAILAVAAALLAAGLVAWRRGRGPALLAGICWTGIAIAPSLAATLSGVAETPVAERYLYLPSVGFALGAGAALGLLLDGAARPVVRRGLLAAFAVLCAVLLAACLQRGLVWQSDLRLWTDAAARAPGYALPRIELGKAQAAQGDLPASLASFELARTLKGSAATRSVASFNAGMSYAQRNEPFRAEQAFREAVTINPGYARGYYGLGRIALERALAPGPASPEERRALLDQAVLELQRAISTSPGYADAWLQLARALDAKGDPAGALLAVGSAERLDPRILARPEVVALRRALELRLSAPKAAGGG